METHKDYLQSMFTTEGNRKYVTTREIKRFLDRAKEADEEKYLLCLVLTYTGCRVTEAINLRLSSLDFETQSIVFLTLKQKKVIRHRQVPVPMWLLTRLLRFTAECPGDRIWRVHRVSAYRWVHEIMAQANLFGVKASPRGLRHGFAIASLEEDVPFPMVSKWMGHVRLRTTAIYTEFVIESQAAFAERRWARLDH